MNAPDTFERVTLRLSPEIKAHIEPAADLAGVSLTDFVVSRADATAEQTSASTP